MLPAKNTCAIKMITTGGVMDMFMANFKKTTNSNVLCH